MAKIVQVSRAFGIPQKKTFVFHQCQWRIFQGHRYPLPPIGVGSIYLSIYSILFYCISSYTLYFIYCIFTCCQVMHAVLLILLWGSVFPCQFFAITLVLVWCVFLQLCVSSVDHVLFLKLCGWGGELQSCFEVLVLLFSPFFRVCFA